MRPMPRRSLAIVIALAALLTVNIASASALTLHRTWTAGLGTNAANGTITLKSYTNGVGSIRYALKGLQRNVVYGIQIRGGTCTNLGAIVAQPQAVLTTATGTVARTDNLYPWVMVKIWPAARKPTFVVRIVHGTSVRCGVLTSAVATRVSVVGLGIDLPVIRGTSAYPPCRVALYLASAAQPREPGVTFIYAHARAGMFLPLLNRWKIRSGASLIGMTVKVWTSDSYVTYYRINRVRKTTNAMVGVFSLLRERLWLQTSTGPNGTYPKLIVEASRYKIAKTTYTAAHPTPHPVRC